MADEDAVLTRYIYEEANTAIARAARHAGNFGLAGAALIGVAAFFDPSSTGLAAPAIASIACGIYAFAVRYFALRGQLGARRLYALLLGFASMPSSLFIASHFTSPAGAATYITGPFTYVYFFPIIVTGFVFDRRLAIVTSVTCAVEYLACVALASDHLRDVQAPDPTQLQDLVSPTIFAFRAAMMLGGGVLVGALSDHAQRLIRRILQGEREKMGIARLFGTFVSPEVSERIVREKSSTIGERKVVVVLFSDIRSFTALSEKLSPEELVEQLNEYFDGMVTAITKHGGTVDKFIGDAVMAVFGGVLELKDPCASAFDAAVAMRAALADLNEARRLVGRPPIENGIGMHYGEVMQGTIGSTDRKEFTVIGDAVNTASRIEGITKEHGFPILISEELFASLPAPRRLRCEPVGAVALKGKAR
ncbi:MAG: adenylate/guanylate cyclase domain-containing protein, partial [Polyangiaceae bacterium]